jgi:uncharacterized repeat protein (TIGR01451 family)
MDARGRSDNQKPKTNTTMKNIFLNYRTLHECLTLKQALLVSIFLLGGLANFAQIPDYVSTNGLVGWWPLNNNGNDYSTNQLNGNAYSTVAGTNRFGELNQASYFNGNNAYIEVPGDYLLNSLPITISIWFLPDQEGEGGALVSKYMNASWNGWNVGIGAPSDSTETLGGHYILQSPYVWGENPCNCGCHGIIEGYGDCGSGINYSAELYDQRWHLSTFVVDSVGGRFYLDGQQVSSQAWAGLPQQVGNWYGMLIGAYRRSGMPWLYYKGMLDDLGIWNRALSNQEIADLYVTSECQPSAHVYNDYNQTCNNTSLGVGGVIMQIQPGNYVVESDFNGDFYFCNLTLADGSYIASIDPSSFGWESNCAPEYNFEVINGALSELPSFFIYNDAACPLPDVSIVCPTMRRCSEHTWPISLQACNGQFATGPLVDSYVIVEFDEGILIENADVPFSSLMNNNYRFETGDINPGECMNVTIQANFSCELELGETLCMEATLFPVPECLQDTVAPPGPCNEPWDHSSLSVEGECDDDTGLITFTIENDGEAMVCPSEVRVYVDGELFATYYIQLGAESDTTFTFPSNGGTWILQADQHPLHPGNSHPNDHVEGCGDIEGEGDGDDDDNDGDNDDDDEWQHGLVDDLPCGDESPFVDVYCGEVVGSFDPNDKQGFPGGVGETHEILPNQQLQYLIRFQNTGTAEAYNIIIRDTLDTDLNIFSVTPGVSSHEYTFTMFGERVLQWTFNNIMLPDSFSNPEQSHGFITYTVNQVPDLTDGTEITNSAAIYFDSNDPIITNTTLHTINHCVFTVINPLVTDLGNGMLSASPAGMSYQWINCSDNEEISDATTNTYWGDDGAYAVAVTTPNACTEQSECAVLLNTEELNSTEINIFPSPASEWINAAWSGKATDYSILSTDGRVVMNGKMSNGANRINITALASGTYFLKTSNHVTRFMVE